MQVIDYIPLQDTYIEAEPEPSLIKTSYVDTEELVECLELFFKGQLDYVSDEYFINLWKPSVRDLIPGKSLVSQLDQTLMGECLNKLTKTHQALIKMEYVPPTYQEYDDANTIAISAFVFSRQPNFTQWASDTLVVAYAELIKIVAGVLVD